MSIISALAEIDGGEKLQEGEWIFIKEICMPYDLFKCSICGYEVIIPSLLCSHCGSKMKLDFEIEKQRR